MKKILIPTDFSQKSCQTIDYTMELFKNETCRFYFLNTYSYNINGLNAIEMLQAEDEWFDKPKEDSLQQLGNLLEEYTVKRSNVKHEFHVISECSNLVKSIEKHTDGLEIDLVVLKGEAVISKNLEYIITKIRSCPVLIVPPDTSTYKTLNLTIASAFKEEIRTFEIDKFFDALENTKFIVNILVLEDVNGRTSDAQNNLKLLVSHLENYFNKQIGITYIKNSSDLKNYATSHLDSIMCITDKKPDLLRMIGLSKSKVISTLKRLHNNAVLTIHQ